MKRRYTKADYEDAARSLAYSVILYSRTSDTIEGRIRDMEEIAETYGGRAPHRLEVELLKEAWEREQAQRAKSGTCLACSYSPPYHDPECPVDQERR